ncbi:MAG: hypothetical protein QOK05_26 [Chloroflexota bacterium]|nr:hypothetical protein [Chloroflexota bacterium]
MNRVTRPRTAVTELKIPAQAAFVVVAKRAASALGTCAGFGLEAIDDLNIAVAQACEKGIAAGDRMWGDGNALLKLTFRLVPGGMEVEVKSLPNRVAAADDEVRQVETMRRTAARLSREVEIERQERIRAQQEVERLKYGRQGAATRGPEEAVEAMSGQQLEDVAVNMIRLFVDELRYNVDARGSVRMRMVKYLAD